MLINMFYFNNTHNNQLNIETHIFSQMDQRKWMGHLGTIPHKSWLDYQQIVHLNIQTHKFYFIWISHIGIRIHIDDDSRRRLYFMDR